MSVMYKFFELFTNNILTQPHFFIGLLVFIGYALLKRPLYESFAGFIKAAVGYLILGVGAGGLVVTFRPILAGLNGRFNLNAAVIDPYFGLNAANSAIESIGSTTSYMMIALLVGFGWNMLLVLFRKYTKVRTLCITGHIMIQQAATITWLVFLSFPQFRNMQGVILTGLLIGTYWAVFTNLTVEPVKDLTDGCGGFAVGHQQMFGVWLVDKLAPKIGNKDKSIDNLELPGWLAIFNDNVVATGTLMLVFFGTLMVILGAPYLREIDPSFKVSTAFPTYIITKSLKFAVYLQILMLGVRMFVAELTESFQGISETVLPGSVPAIDCAAVYSFSSPNTILFGFIFGLIGQLIAIAGLLVFKSPIMIITGFVPVFFDNATLAVFANKKGGIKAAAVLTFCSGIIQVLGGAFAAAYFKLYKFGGWHGNFDFDTLWPVIGVAINKLALPGVFITIVLMLVIPHLQYRRDTNKEEYFEVIA
ncbi:PTS system IIC component (L-Asc family) [Orenia metallireducens]|uniref:Ascorbate-specific PTS system EIIC component n=1 Tax=Orenia metallireducens TaxID=1413210 RepID=A0A285FXZ8_9FIRM|nr:PTS ascorbate transporter subunit IIC [Orenia metallireducens]PRX35538.1 PTS system IIC component (L-Asc family) [Orenia metallireducens]SNY16147.1 PTS system IIC component, L-Asc family [Orenia metallireducens]